MISVQNYNNPYNYQTNKCTAFGQNPYTPQYQDNNRDNTGKLLASAGLLQVLSSGLNKASEWLGNKLITGKEFTSAENVQKVVHDMCKNNKLDIEVGLIDRKNLNSAINRYGHEFANDLAIVADGKNAFYHDGKKFAVAPKSKPALLPHELGHAVNAKSGFLRALQKSRKYSVFAPAAAVLLSRSIPSSPDGKKNFIERNAGVLGFCAFLPTIIEEGIASLRGIKQSARTLGKSVSLSALKRNYLLAWGTYVLAGIGLGIGTKYAIVEDKLKNGC